MIGTCSSNRKKSLWKKEKMITRFFSEGEGWIENIAGIGQTASYQHFLLLKASFLGSLKVMIGLNVFQRMLNR